MSRVFFGNSSVVNLPFVSGQYYVPPYASMSTTNTLGVNNLRSWPWIFTSPVSIAQIGLEVTVVGDAGSTLRVGIYSDTGGGYPKTLLVEGATQILGDSATNQLVNAAITLSPGIYWFAHVLQNVTVTQPTVRSFIPVVAPGSTSAFAGGVQVFGYSQASVTGALPGTFTATLAAQASNARLYIKVA